MHQATHPEPPKPFIAWWRAHPHGKHGLPARVAYKCQCYLDEYKAACLLAPLLTTAQPVPGARRKAGQGSGVQ
jgi:hypothetical protein